MTVRNRIKTDEAFQYAVQSLELLSPVGHRRLMSLPFCNDVTHLEQEWDRMDTLLPLLQDTAHAKPLAELRHQLMSLHDIRNTLLQLQSHQTMTEVDLFEIKHLAHLTGAIRHNLNLLGVTDLAPLPDLDTVYHLLDPDNTGIDNFYIYDSYDPSLAPLRRALRQLQSDNSESQQAVSDLLERHDAIQQAVIQRLSGLLAPHAALLQEALETAGYWDLLLAKTQQALDWHLCRPQCGDRMELRELVHPQLSRRHHELGLRYQPVDITVQRGVCLITGANMAGKTVLLKAIGCAQLMAQHGMFVAARSATLPTVDDVVSCIGDEQDALRGLSSFAAEILRISDNLRRSRRERLLLLIDEPARTTNPVEGRAIVRSLATLLSRQEGYALLTTHYSGLDVDCRRLRVRGFDETLSQQPVNAGNISSFIDYSLEEDLSDTAPREALRIAELLGCDEEMIKEAKASL
ncbi:MAG: DNA mismatch repair protein MutS domain-containing protein [bacterium P3]|nr:MAG: DNA mismatch repair protein MutS domain-containing protein [bacterium P3]KWW40378.1 MAG: DNA mismatch repair protein MutS domain-containing protein [bacterium F083]